MKPLIPVHFPKAKPDSRLNAIKHLPESARSASPTILESKGIKVTFNDNAEPDEELFRAIALKCKSWLCSECRLVKGLKLRKRFLEKAEFFKDPKIYTITVCRDWFSSPEKAYSYVMEQKFIARLLTKEMKVRNWIWVLEAQEENGEGWPHWHILIDVSKLPPIWYKPETKETSKKRPSDIKGWIYVPHFFDLNKVHRLLRKWKIGEQCKLSERKENFDSPQHAINYITKYLIKTPERGFPEWMLNHPRLRFYQPSYDVGSLSVEEKKEKTSSAKAKEPTRHYERRMPVERIAECGRKTFFLGYNKELDKYVVTPPTFGLRESVRAIPGFTALQDFDFKTKRSFEIIGFKKFSDVEKFYETWRQPLLLDTIIEQIEVKEKQLLTQWKEYIPPPKEKAA